MNKLRGKARLDFEEWIFNTYPDQVSLDDDYAHVYIGSIRFYDLPTFVQFSYYVEWFSTVGIFIGRKDTNTWWVLTGNSDYFKNGEGYVEVLKKRLWHAIDFAQSIYKGLNGF